MASFAALVADVYTITNRPDLVAETALAVKSATLQLHRSDNFYKDIKEVALQFDTNSYLQEIDYRDIFPNYRSLVYLRKFDPTASLSESKGVGSFIKVVTPGMVVDSYNSARSDICYVAGDKIQIKSATPIQYCLIGVYLNPIVATEATYKSWISDEAYYAIVYKAASILFGSVLNNPAKKRSNDDLALQEFIEVKNSNIVAEGY